MRAVIYARYSSDLQKQSSIVDQIRVCEEHVRRNGWTVTNCYTDQSLSGASMNRPGIQQMMRDASDQKFDIVVAEALDRISRDQADTATIHKQLKFLGIRISTISEGDVGIIDVGVKAMLNQLFLVEMRQKVLRGQRGRVEAGKIPAGLAYGYDVVRRFDENGKQVSGERTINPEKAEIVRRIFRDYVDGKSARHIAMALNAEGVPSPAGKGWHTATIKGDVRRGFGILNNTIYAGILTWNRTREDREPGTNRRVPRINPEEQWSVKEIPELAIIDRSLWDQAKARQSKYSVARSGDFRKSRRPKYLLSGLLKCGACGGGMSLWKHGKYHCSRHLNTGTCSNPLGISRAGLEASILGALQKSVMNDALLKVFCERYTRTINEMRMRQSGELTRLRAEFARLERARKRCIEAIKGGVPGSEVKDEMIAIAERRSVVERKMAASGKPSPVLLHPTMAQHFQRTMSDLVSLLNDPDATAPREAVRELINTIVLQPDLEAGKLIVDLHGDLAGILQVAEAQAESGDMKIAINSSESSQEKKRESVGNGRVAASRRIAINPVVLMVGLEEPKIMWKNKN